MSHDTRTVSVTVDEDGDVEVPEDIAEVVEANRETLELVAAGEDGAAEIAENILAEAEDHND